MTSFTVEAGEDRGGRSMRRFFELCGDRRGHLVIIALLMGMTSAIGTGGAGEPGLKPQPAQPGASRAAMVAASKQVYRVLVRSGDTIKTASGFLVSGRRVIATNHHVADRGTTFVAGYLDAKGGIKRVDLRLLASFPQKDLALLEAREDLPGEALPLAGDYPEFASDLFAIGFPSAADLMVDEDGMRTDDSTFFAPSVAKGSVSRVVTANGAPHQIQHQTPISSGYSGGPLVVESGVVVGVSSAIHKVASGIAYAVSSVDLTRLLVACSLPIREAYVSVASAASAPLASMALFSATTLSNKTQEPASPGDRIMMRRANEMFGQGNIASARAIFEFLAEKKKLPEAYAGLARTYDPHFLEGFAVGGVSADPEKAQEFYRMADRRPASGSVNGGCDRSLCSLLQSSSGAWMVICSKS
jgi:S1-C subfamily serine protease